jgi:hypothetical protein
VQCTSFRYRGASAADRGDLTLEEVVATADGGPAAKIGLLLADHEKTLQDLVSQIVTHWKVPPLFARCTVLGTVAVRCTMQPVSTPPAITARTPCPRSCTASAPYT